MIVNEGYAWASSSYRRGGFGVSMAAEDTENARKLFVEAFGRPKRTIIYGQSYGGTVAAKVAELYAVSSDGAYNCDGALLTSGSVAGGAEYYSWRADMHAIYQYYCRNLPRPNEAQYPAWQGLPLDNNLTAVDLESRVNECTGIKLPAVERSEKQKQTLANILDVSRTPERNLLFNMSFGTSLIQDMVQRRLSGRSPFSNIDVQYNGSTDDAALNRDVERFASDPKAVAELDADSALTGEVTIPVLTIHAIDDPTVPVEVHWMYRETLQKAGAGDRLVQTFTDEHVHSKLSTPQYAALLAALKDWMETGRKPSPQSISNSCGRFSAAYKEPCLFLPGYQPKSLWTRVYERRK